MSGVCKNVLKFVKARVNKPVAAKNRDDKRIEKKFSMMLDSLKLL
jgi:hypothetical protein